LNIESKAVYRKSAGNVQENSNSTAATGQEDTVVAEVGVVDGAVVGATVVEVVVAVTVDKGLVVVDLVEVVTFVVAVVVVVVVVVVGVVVVGAVVVGVVVVGVVVVIAVVVVVVGAVVVVIPHSDVVMLCDAIGVNLVNPVSPNSPYDVLYHGKRRFLSVSPSLEYVYVISTISTLPAPPTSNSA
jgi:hypothetical protein